MTKDPVCGAPTDSQQSSGASQYNGQIFYFCSSDCKYQFNQDPQRYVDQPTS
jgi:YHS domain-containing protein